MTAYASCILYSILFYYSAYIISVCSRAALQEENENICDGVIYADPGRRSRWSTRGSYLRGMPHQLGGSSQGVGYNLGV